MEYCQKCKMPKIDWGMDRCYCAPELSELDEDPSVALDRAAYISALLNETRYWLPPILYRSELAAVDLKGALLPISIFCVEGTIVFENDGNGWTYIDEYGIRQDA